MIYGVGTDICDIRRMQATLDRQGQRFAERVLGPAELACWHERRSRAPARGVAYLATRFAAKEALAKAIGLGMRAPMTWQACEILNRQPDGAPDLQTHGALTDWMAERGLRAHISITDETDYAAAFVVVETKGNTA